MNQFKEGDRQKAESLMTTRNERLREKAEALLDVMHGLEEFYDEMIALREELDRYDDETETDSEVES